MALLPDESQFQEVERIYWIFFNIWVTDLSLEPGIYGP